ncbi:MAG: ROK family protein, partial [Actinomycetota bacterium]
MSATDCVAALDVGGTTIKGAVVDRDGTVLVRLRRPTPTRDGGSDRVLTAILAVVEELTAAAPGGGGVRAVGLAVTGIVDERRGIAVHSENVGWRDVP